jgi:hypothetical protein
MMLGRLMMAGALLAVPLAPGLAQTSPFGDRAQLFTVAGFRIVADRPVNRCGAPANPRVTLLDYSGDKQKNEAIFTDAGPCYAPDNAYFALVARDGPNGRWRLLFSHTGTVRAIGQGPGGWLDLQYSSGGRTVPIRYADGVYAPVGAAPARPAPVTAAPVQASAGMVSPTVKPAALTPAQRTAIFKAAGAVKRGTKWLICSDQPDPGGATIESIRDLNGDGRAEALVIEGGTYCYGNTGAYFSLVGQQPDGTWKQITAETGIAEFKAKGPGGWPDLEIGGPGFCFPVERWNGKEYVQHHFNEYMKGMCARNGLKPAVRAY